MVIFELFYTFFLIGLFTFGGGYAMIPMIEDAILAHGETWGVSSSMLTDFIAISESTPGPFAINIATFIGSKTAGFVGSLVATIGVILPSFIIILLVAWIFSKIFKNRFVKGALNGVKPIVIGLIASTTLFFLIKMALYGGNAIYSQSIDFDRTSVALLAMLFITLRFYKSRKKKSLNPILILLISAALGVIFFYILKY